MGPSMYYVRIEGRGSVRIGILRTSAYGGEGRGPDRCVHISVISVQEIISILVFMQFTMKSI